jgi:hypothetical protein
MEDIEQKLIRIQSDVEKVTELYDYAEQLYSYENIRQPREVRI